ncbi:hypothetical protein B484DRAFT_147346 [Ochromonadaceae sp. CCMP2298]|nr:hypothetical protein B484DRAFT_147346 [Ochromonadaceae sp. CCMP2298]
MRSLGVLALLTAVRNTPLMQSEAARSVLFTLTLLATFTILCMIFYHFEEGWSYTTSLFFMVVTMSTVGYGYHYPTTIRSQIFTTFVMVFGTFAVYGSINKLVVAYLTQLRTREREKQDRETHLTRAQIYRNHRFRYFSNIMTILVALLVAAGVFSWGEGWNFWTALYFSVQTATTVGFGDLELKSGYSHIFLGIYIIFSTILFAFMFNNFVHLGEEFDKVRNAADLAQRKRQLDVLKELDTGNGVPQDTFVLAVLLQLGRVDPVVVERWVQKFRQIDVHSTGSISALQIDTFCAQEAASADEHLEELEALPGLRTSLSSSSNPSDPSQPPSSTASSSTISPLTAAVERLIVGISPRSSKTGTSPRCSKTVMFSSSLVGGSGGSGGVGGGGGGDRHRHLHLGFNNPSHNPSHPHNPLHIPATPPVQNCDNLGDEYTDTDAGAGADVEVAGTETDSHTDRVVMGAGAGGVRLDLLSPSTVKSHSASMLIGRGSTGGIGAVGGVGCSIIDENL